jgi:hypothetical protein
VIAPVSRRRRAQVKPKAKSSFSSLSSAFTSVLSVSSSGRSPPELVPEQQLAACSGNWLSHLDWDGKRCGPAAAAVRGPLAARASGLSSRSPRSRPERPRPLRARRVPLRAAPSRTRRPLCTHPSCSSAASWPAGSRAHAERAGRASRYWTLAEAEPRAWQVPPAALPSDARERADLVALSRGDLKAAQVAPAPCNGAAQAGRALEGAPPGFRCVAGGPGCGQAAGRAVPDGGAVVSAAYAAAAQACAACIVQQRRAR